MAVDILVCQAGSCRKAGSEATLIEIEELVSGSDAKNTCAVHQSGCLGLCSQAPGVVVVKNRRNETPFTRLSTSDAIARMIEFAAGIAASVLLQSCFLDENAKRRLEDIRLSRSRQYAASVFKWNTALKGLSAQVKLTGEVEQIDSFDAKKFVELAIAQANLLEMAGFWKDGCKVLQNAEKRFFSLGKGANQQLQQSLMQTGGASSGLALGANNARQAMSNKAFLQEQLENLTRKKISLLSKHADEQAVGAIEKKLEQLMDSSTEVSSAMNPNEKMMMPVMNLKRLLLFIDTCKAKMLAEATNVGGGGEKEKWKTFDGTTTTQQMLTDLAKAKRAGENDASAATSPDSDVGAASQDPSNAIPATASASSSSSAVNKTSERNRNFVFPEAIDNYTKWTLEKVTPVSYHSAVFHFSSQDKKRATPHPRGRGKMPIPKTWHTTLLAPRNLDLVLQSKSQDEIEDEGPLPWVERDYTPISSAKEWELGTCDILIKIYPDGQATSWLHTISKRLHSTSDQVDEPSGRGGEDEFRSSSRVVAGTEVVVDENDYHADINQSAVAPSSAGGSGDVVMNSQEQAKTTTPSKDVEISSNKIQIYLSQPVITLTLPHLIPEDAQMPKQIQKSILLVLGGTGVVALPQVLAHRDPYSKLNIATRKTDQLKIAIDLVLSCRKDDILMLPEILQWCKEGSGAGPAGAEEESEYQKKRRLANGPQGLRNCVLHLTGETSSVASDYEENNGDVTGARTMPFSSRGFDEMKQHDQLAEFEGLPNCELVRNRISVESLKKAVSRMVKDCRVIVSGPSGFNAVVRTMLKENNVTDDMITILTA
ncbi:unnamed protein product [Amoebophrya sp. A120]|nr:unnamed protein product [Amoebophrya sp. A120]|eukprot:GSA120T00008125001.1